MIGTEVNMTNYDEYRKNNTYIEAFCVASVLSIVVIAIFAYDLINDNFNDEHTFDILGMLVIGIGYFLLAIYLIGRQTIIICNQCNDYIDYEKEFYITNCEHRIEEKKKYYHLTCFTDNRNK